MTLRHWTRTLAASLLLGYVGIGCNGDAPASNVDGGGIDAPRGSGSGGGAFGRDGGTGRDLIIPEARPDLPPPPPPNMDAKLIVPGRARLVGTHTSACSNQVPASGNGDRWCAFSLPGKTIGQTDLWVINVTKAMGGTAVKCNQDAPTADPNCLRLTDRLWTGQPDGGPSHPTAHRFDGDTLIFHAEAPTNVDLYRGKIFGWRPGWPEAKQVSSTDKAITCSGHPSAEVVVCLENITPDNVMPVQFDLTAGKLASGAQTIARLTPLRAGGSVSQWRAGFNRKGDWFAWSTGGKTVQEKETLYAIKTDDLANPDKAITVATGVARWQISADGQRWYYLRNYNYSDQGDPSGTLMMAPFPNGVDANETQLAAKVGAFQLLLDGTDNDRGIGFFDNVASGNGTYKIMRDVNKPDDVVQIVRGTSGALMSRDLRYVFYSKNVDDDNGTTDAFIAKADGSGSCTLVNNPTTDLFGTPFTASSSMVFWADNIDPVDGVGEGWVATPEGCAGKKKWAPKGIDFWFIAGDMGMLYSDEGDGEVATLKHVTFPGGNSIGSPTTIAQQVGRVFAVLPGFQATLFSITRSTNFDGLYVYSKLPFQSQATPPGDGGAPRAPDAAAQPAGPDAARTDGM